MRSPRGEALKYTMLTRRGDRPLMSVLLTTYGGVFLAEIVGDKLLYTSGVLATRYRWVAIVCGMALAFMAKMSVAVAVGVLIGKLLPLWLVASLTGVSFLGVAITMWRKPDVRKPKEKDSRICGARPSPSSRSFCRNGATKA